MVITVSCYAVHSVVASFLVLWRWVQMVKDWMIAIFTFCCRIKCVSKTSKQDEQTCTKFNVKTKMLRVETLESSKPKCFSQPVVHSDKELRRKYHPPTSSSEEVEVSYSEITLGPSARGKSTARQACGDQELSTVLDFAPTTEDTEIELKSQVYDVESNSDSESMKSSHEQVLIPTSLQNCGGRGDNLQRCSHCCPETDIEMEVENHLPKSGSSKEIMSYYYEIVNIKQRSIAKQAEKINKETEQEKNTNHQPIEPVLGDYNHGETDNENSQINSTSQIWEFQSCIQCPKVENDSINPCVSSNMPESLQELELKSRNYNDSCIEKAVMEAPKSKPRSLRGSPEPGRGEPVIQDLPGIHASAKRR